jgi:hypothetical protein
VTTLSARLAHLEKDRGNVVKHRPTGMSIEDFISRMCREAAGVPDAQASEFFGPWVAAMTPDECRCLLDLLNEIAQPGRST